MGGAGAAASAARRKDQRQRDAARKRRKQRDQRAARIFLKLSPDGKVLPEKVVGDFLSEFLIILKDDLDTEGVRLVVGTARKKSGASDGVTDLSKDAFLGAVKKYGEYMKKSDEINKMFNEFDMDKDGVLSREELQKALNEQERSHERIMRVEVDEDDLDFILENCDLDGNGCLSRHEVLAAIGAWDELANVKIETGRAKPPPCCFIL
mmetsp:Transcript_26115/g.53476  ORF Transcript_26115/g.53476 Transcript_26115/m.53476 type:complete len:208 (-) Transcript_26115:157-780(-)|eukprot:CAMPEP_0183292066 /NCGR_PEP_ID=MMETSP0160_2-20130417/1271_1 /TAXON_ID=2839 ORGANISM="Odontella Sinensis, Strain Grunow 1884" /NCGR_SAMPLE_ID=MMETSP0160_2 /ASSEMBLY_ACC=CAM_ASM_000250 /LENGTH=207 /DNA_ID=CAMNT_0025452973 /DNA_START=62 /DNA_END=685 /DNA_ORIENTATION=+